VRPSPRCRPPVHPADPPGWPAPAPAPGEERPASPGLPVPHRSAVL